MAVPTTAQALAQISAQLASSKDGGYLEKIADKLNANERGNQNDPFAGFKIPKLTDIAKGLTFGLAPGLIKKSVAGMQIFMNSLNSMQVDDVEKSSKIIQLVDTYSDAMTNFGNIPWMKALKGTFLLEMFSNRFKKIGAVLGSKENLRALIPFKKYALAFGIPLKLIGNALSSFAKIRWTSAYISTKFLKKITAALGEIGKTFAGNEKTFEKMGQVMEKLTEPLTAFGETFKQIGNTLIKAAFSLLIVAGALGLTAISLKQFAGVKWEDALKGIGTLTALSLIGKLISDKSSKSMVIMAGALAATALSLKLFEKVDFASVAVGMTALASLAGISHLLAKGSQSMIKGAAALSILGVSILPLAYTLKMFNGIDFASVMIGTAALIGLSKAAAALALLIKPIAIGAAAIAILGASIIPLAYALKMLSDIDWKAFKGIVGALGKLALGAAAIGLAAPAMLAASLAILPFTAGLKLLSFVIAKDRLMITFLDKFKNSIKNLKGGALFDVAKGITALGASLLAFSSAEVISGVGTLIGKILNFGSDSPIERLIKLADHGHNLSILGTGIKNLSKGLWSLQGLDGKLDILDQIPKKLKGLSEMGIIGSGINLIAESITSLFTALSALSQLDGKLNVLNNIPFDKLKSLSESIKPGSPLIQIVNGLQESPDSKKIANFLHQNIKSNGPTTGAELKMAGTNATSATTVVVNNNNGGNVTNNSSTSSNVNNNGSFNAPIITASSSGMFTGF